MIYRQNKFWGLRLVLKFWLTVVIIIQILIMIVHKATLDQLVRLYRASISCAQIASHLIDPLRQHLSPWGWYIPSCASIWQESIPPRVLFLSIWYRCLLLSYRLIPMSIFISSISLKILKNFDKVTPFTSHF